MKGRPLGLGHGPQRSTPSLAPNQVLFQDNLINKYIAILTQSGTAPSPSPLPPSTNRSLPWGRFSIDLTFTDQRFSPHPPSFPPATATPPISAQPKTPTETPSATPAAKRAVFPTQWPPVCHPPPSTLDQRPPSCSITAKRISVPAYRPHPITNTSLRYGPDLSRRRSAGWQYESLSCRY